MHSFLKAKAAADRIVEILWPYTNQIDIAGSIRREKAEVKDIEIVCIPERKFIKTDLFGGGFEKVTPEFTQSFLDITTEVIKGNTEGRYMQVKIKGGFVVDLFMPAPADYYRQLAMRTGSAEYSSFIIAGGWRRQGWCGVNSIGLRRISDCIQLSDNSWKCMNLDGELPPVWKNEQQFFDWINVKWIHPKFREVKNSVNIYR